MIKYINLSQGVFHNDIEKCNKKGNLKSLLTAKAIGIMMFIKVDLNQKK